MRRKGGLLCICDGCRGETNAVCMFVLVHVHELREAGCDVYVHDKHWDGGRGMMTHWMLDGWADLLSSNNQTDEFIRSDEALPCLTFPQLLGQSTVSLTS